MWMDQLPIKTRHLRFIFSPFPCSFHFVLWTAMAIDLNLISKCFFRIADFVCVIPMYLSFSLSNHFTKLALFDLNQKIMRKVNILLKEKSTDNNEHNSPQNSTSMLTCSAQINWKTQFNADLRKIGFGLFVFLYSTKTYANFLLNDMEPIFSQFHRMNSLILDSVC